MKKVLGIIFAMLLCVYATQVSFGTAATAPVNTPSRTGDSVNIGVYTNTIIYAGTMVCMNSSGYAIPGADASGNIVLGRATKTVDNRTNATGAGDSGALKINVERGIFGWKQTGTAISDTSIGSLAYVFDDNLVTNASAGNAIIAGVIVDYSDSLVWVDTFNIGRTVGSFTTLAASGASTLSGVVTASTNLVVTGNQTLAGTLIGSSTIAASGYKIGATSAITRAITNNCVGSTNISYFTGGILMSNTVTGTP